MLTKKPRQKNEKELVSSKTPLTDGLLTQSLANMEDSEIISLDTNLGEKIFLYYIKTLIDNERLNEVIVEPLKQCSKDQINKSLLNAKIKKLSYLEEAEKEIVHGSVLLYDPTQNHWLAVPLETKFTRSIEPPETETVIYGAKDSFVEQIDQNITMIRQRLPITALKTETFTIGSLSRTKVVMMYIEGLTNPEFISIAREKMMSIDFDQFFDASQVEAFIEDHRHTLFPQFLETERPDVCSHSLVLGKLVFLVDKTPNGLIGPINFFNLFQSPQDYFLRWFIASFLRCIRFFSFFLTLTLVPLYVALTEHHYQVIPLQILYVLLKSRSQLPFTPFWEATIMLITLEIIKEASLRMPTKSGQILGVIGGIVISQATVQAGVTSNILIVSVGISAITSFLVPDYLMTKIITLLRFFLLVLSQLIGLPGIVLGMFIIFVHLIGLTSLKQPYLAPITPLYLKDWNDLFIRVPLSWIKERPRFLSPLQKWRIKNRR
ncbi:spore germination protein [Pullulanibacillus sp. KACC 23026]|uniref:spore germination protein n=1 Tax=Pullulanibacillus sp. KACC 23026 TaxID=3028315 RepID=UPI0023AEC1E4|nr:spore germination protein [Pullulanibacillus sp. KACC 23026]WEG14677.1 spore germination protein [Pullulanibacillus sp. KACC 23026]